MLHKQPNGKHIKKHTHNIKFLYFEILNNTTGSENIWIAKTNLLKDIRKRFTQFQILRWWSSIQFIQYNYTIIF